MTEQAVLDLLKKMHVIRANGHFVYTSGRHGSVYVDKDAIYPHVKDTSELCRTMAEHFSDYPIEVVVAPAVGGLVLSQWVAYHLSELTGRYILSVYAEKEETPIIFSDNYRRISLQETSFSPRYGDVRTGGSKLIELYRGEQLVKKNKFFSLRRSNFSNIVANRTMLVVEDILTTGGTAKSVVEAVRVSHGDVVGLAAICNRGKVTAETVGNVPELFTLSSLDLETWSEEECPLCAQNIPIDTSVGKGKDFIARQL